MAHDWSSSKEQSKIYSRFINLIHSLDRISLAKEIDRQVKKEERIIDCLIQIKISKEDSKFGLKIEDFTDFYKSLETYENYKYYWFNGNGYVH